MPDAQPSPTFWQPEQRITVRFDVALAARLDAYCNMVNRSRASAIRQLVAIALREFEEEVERLDESARSGGP